MGSVGGAVPRDLERAARAWLLRFRRSVETAFGPDTSADGFAADVPSAGQCAAVAALLNEQIGGDFVSARVQGVSHWFNRISFRGMPLDVDVTGDQFGLDAVRVGLPGRLYPDTRIRRPDELNAETRRRAALLASRAKIYLAVSPTAE